MIDMPDWLFSDDFYALVNGCYQLTSSPLKLIIALMCTCSALSLSPSLGLSIAS